MRIALPPPCRLALPLLLLAACDAAPPPSANPAAAPQEAILQSGDTTVRATVMQTSALGDAVAAQYGIERGDGIVMLLVGVRQGPPMQEVSVPVTVTATATDLRGNRHSIPMRELQAGDLVDHVGTLRVDPPETLSFELDIRRDGAAPMRMQFNRDIGR